MASFFRLVCSLLICSLTIVLARSTTESPLTDSLSKAQDTSLKAQGTFIRGYAGELIDGSLKELLFRLAALKTQIGVLIEVSNTSSAKSEACISAMNNLALAYAASDMENRLSDLRMEFEKHNVFEVRIIQLREIIGDIRGGRYKFAYGKFIQLDPIPKVIHDVYDYSTSGLDIVKKFSAAATNSTHCFAMLKSLTEDILTSERNKVLDLIQLANIIEKERLNCNSNDTTFRKQLDRQIETAVIDTLVTSMKSGDFSSNKTVGSLLEILKFRSKLSDNIMSGLIDRVYGVIEPRVILSNIFIRCDTSHAVLGIANLFWKIRDGGLYNGSDLIIDISENLRDLRNRKDYTSLSKEVKSSFDKVIESIPICAKNLILEKSVCLWNKAKDVYLQAVSDEFNYDRERRRILTTAASKDIPKAAAWIPIKQGNDILFKNREYPNEFLYYADFEYNSQMRYVFSWIAGNNTDSQSAFKIQLLNYKSCYLKSSRYNEYLFASDVKFEKDENYSYPFAWKAGSADGLDSAIVWEIRACYFNREEHF